MVRAIVQTAPYALELREFPRPATGPDDGLLRVEANGLCGSDVEIYRGGIPVRPAAMIPGHEPVGVIEELGERAAARWGLAVGDRVAVEILAPCRACRRCLLGAYQSCPHRRISHGMTGIDVAPALYGGLAEYVYLSPTAILHPISAALAPEIASMANLIGAGVRWTRHLGGVDLGDTLLVLGAGQRGLAAVVAARAVGAGTVIVTGLAADAHKLALARELGADHTLVVDGPDAVDVVEAVGDLTGGAMADVALELTPMAHAPVAHALRAVRHGGRVVLAGLKGGADVGVPTDVIINRALSVVGAFGVDARGYAEAIALIESGRFALNRLHTHTFGLEDTELALRTLGGEIPGEAAVHVSVHP